MYSLNDLHPTRSGWIRKSRLPVRSLGTTLDDLAPYVDDSRDVCVGWLDAVCGLKIVKAEGSELCGVGLLLVGKPGSGKTTLATTVLQEVGIRAKLSAWVSREIPSLPLYFTTYPDALMLAQKSYDRDEDAGFLVDRLFGRARNSDDDVRILVLDDLGKEHRTASGWSENWFDHLLRARFDRGLPTIVTTNIPISDWGRIYGEPMASFAHQAFQYTPIISAEGDRRL